MNPTKIDLEITDLKLFHSVPLSQAISLPFVKSDRFDRDLARKIRASLLNRIPPFRPLLNTIFDEYKKAEKKNLFCFHCPANLFEILEISRQLHPTSLPKDMITVNKNMNLVGGDVNYPLIYLTYYALVPMNIRGHVYAPGLYFILIFGDPKAKTISQELK